MESKSHRTISYILEKVSPIFNRKGYIGTSLSDLTHATGLSKGALYGNFKNKEELALEAFRLNLKKVIEPLSQVLEKTQSPRDKLFHICDFYQSYYTSTQEIGGCPLLKVGMDAQDQNPLLFNSVQKISKKLENQLISILEQGIYLGEFQENLKPEYYANIIFSMIEGSIFMSFIHEDPVYLETMILHLKQIIQTEILIKLP